MYKTCIICGCEKPITDFSVNKANKVDGYTKDCKVCRNIKNVEYRKLNHEKELERYKKYNLDNPEKIAKKNKEWYEKNYIDSAVGRAHVRGRQKKYRMSDLGRVTKKDLEHKRRSQVYGNFYQDSKEAIKMLRQSATHCFYCKCELEQMHIDHFIPLARGGSHSANNLVASCPTCNLKKKDKDPYLFMEEMGVQYA